MPAVTAAERYHFALMRYGDQLFQEEQYCAAHEQYQIASSIGPLDEQAARNSNQAFQLCFPATEVLPTIGPTVDVTPTTGATEPPIDTPTAPPTEPPVVLPP